MREGFDVNGERLTAGDLRASLEGVPDDTPLVVCVPPPVVHRNGGGR